MEVWIVTNGEQHEGGEVVGVGASRENAEALALAVRPIFRGGWKETERLPEHTVWENGCDYLKVQKFSVL